MKNQPAFPCQYEEHLPMCNGMTLRDYFAGQALAGNLEQGVEDDINYGWWHDSSKVAKRAYSIADAMLKARGE